jgi:hypothetical protein
MPDPVQNFEPARRHVGTGSDTDRDGLSDDFERNVFHSDPTQRDADGDGLSDWAEYWLDTNPNNPDTDGDQWTDGEDLAFGDPLRPNAGGAERAKFLADTRKQFDAEGSDRDKDFVRDHVEKSFGTKPDDPDSDNDGLGDMIELQLKTNPNSPVDDTTDLDAARRQLGERRWAAEEAARGGSSSSLDGAAGDGSTGVYAGPDTADSGYDTADSLAASDGQPSYEQPAYDQPVYEEAEAAEADVTADEGSFDGLA